MSCKNLKFVIDKHKAKRAGLHYDLRIQRCDNKDILFSYAIRKGVPTKTGLKHLAVRTPDHSKEWLTFQGEIPSGEYGAGTIEKWDKGTVDLLSDNGKVKLYNFHGEKIKGIYAIIHLKKDQYLIVKTKKKISDK